MKDINIVLVEPEIPQNTGNIGRTCVALGATLHFVGELGFSLDDRNLKRAGMDYWSRLTWDHHEGWNSFLETIEGPHQMLFVSTKGKKDIWEINYQRPLYLVFGNESRGLPPSFYKKYEEKLVRIPMTDGVRSLNLSTSVGIAAFEAARQLKVKIN